MYCKSTFKNIFLSVLCALLFQGCSVWSAIPVTLKEVKDYVVGQEQSFSHPINQVLAATVHNLRQAGFSVEQIEYFNEKGLIKANWKETSVILDLNTITPSLTKARTKISRGEGYREFSSEQEMFNNVRRVLDSGKPLNWETLTAGMVKVHVKPDGNSPVIAYLGPGVKADLLREEGKWGEIQLMDGGTGFIALKHLKPAPVK